MIEKRKHRHVKEIPLAPVLDLLTVVIFFLILSTSFEEFRQNEVPPAMLAKPPTTPVSETPEIPKNPKLLVRTSAGKIQLLLKWLGKEPGQVVADVPLSADYNVGLKTKTAELTKDFFEKNRNEKSLQLGFVGSTVFQDVLTVMDGVMSVTKDVALISHQESQMLFEGSL